MKKSTKNITIAAAIIALYLMTTTKSFAKTTTSNKIRTQDVHGNGAFGSPRTHGTHQGEDYIAAVGETIFAPISGTVTRYPFPYKNDLSMKGIEIINADYVVKIFYLNPTAKINSVVQAGQPIGIAQNIAGKYSPGMQNHIHIEVRNKAGKLLQFSKLL